jgi:hypothetical protein
VGRSQENRGNNWLEQNAVDTVSRLFSYEGQFAKVAVAGSTPTVITIIRLALCGKGNELRGSQVQHLKGDDER